MSLVVISYRNGVQKEVLLAGVPRVGDQIRLRDAAPGDPALMVDSVVWVQGDNNGSPDPQVMIMVHTHDV